MNIELAKHINLHANGEPLLKQSSHIHFFPSSTTILFVVWSANGDGSALSRRASFEVMTILTDGCVQLQLCHPSDKKSKVRIK